MRKILFLLLTLSVTLGAVMTSAPRAEAATCGWRCVCGHALCPCVGGPPTCGEPRPDCPPVVC